MKKVLPLAKPIITAWPENAFLSSLVLLCDDGYDWLMDTHIQIYGSTYKHISSGVTDKRITFYPMGGLQCINIFHLCPFIVTYEFPRETIELFNNSFIQMLKYYIDKDIYLQIPNFQYYRTDRQYIHPSYFYGYDDELQEVYIADNIDNGVYTQTTISYEIFEKSCQHPYVKNYDIGCINGFKIFPYITYHIDDYSYVQRQYKDYLTSGEQNFDYIDKFLCPENPYSHKNDTGQVLFGHKAFKILDELVADAQKTRFLDARAWVFLKDYIDMTIHHYHYYVKKQRITPSVAIETNMEKCNNSCKILISLASMYKIRPDDKTLQRMMKQTAIIQELLFSINTYFYEELSASLEKL